MCTVTTEVYRKVSSIFHCVTFLVVQRSVQCVIMDVQVSSPCHDNDVMQKTMCIMYGNCQRTLLWKYIYINVCENIAASCYLVT